MPPKRPPPGLAMTPAPKRPQITQGGVASVDLAEPPLPSPRERVLRSTVLVLFFVVQVKGDRRHRRFRRMIRAENAMVQKKVLEEIDCAFQKQIDCAFQKHLAPVYCKLESFGRKITHLSHEVEEIKHSHPNHYADEYPRSEANQEHAAVVEEANEKHTAVVEVTNQEQTTAFDGLTTSEACDGASVQLRFLNCLKSLVYNSSKKKSLVYTERKITAQDGMAIKIAIFRDNQIITSGRLSSARIEILALHGDFFNVVSDNWTENEFDGRVVQGTVLGGNCELKLENGMVSLDDICFKKVSSKTDSGKFILAARVHWSDRDGRRVKEAVMNPVEVQVSRNEPNKKSDRPKLEEDASCLRGISRKGPFLKRLQENNICTVESFLKAKNKDEDKLCNECFKLNKNSRSWKNIVQHANECDLEGNRKLKSYTSADQNVILFFNCVHDLIGAKFRGCYRAKDNFAQDHQDLVNGLRKDAYNKLDSIEFDHVMEGNCPKPFSTIANISGDASPGTSGTNPPYHPTTPQGVPNIGAGATIPGQIAPPEQYRPRGNQGDQSSDEMAGGYPQGPPVENAAEGYCMTQSSNEPLLVTPGTYSGGNNFSGTMLNAAQLPTDDFFDGLTPLDIPQQTNYVANICGGASPGTAGTNPPYHPTTPQGVPNIDAGATIPGQSAPPEQHRPHGNQDLKISNEGDQSSDEMARDCPQGPRVDIAAEGNCMTQSSNEPLLVTSGTYSGGNNFSGTMLNAAQHPTDDFFDGLTPLDIPQQTNYETGSPGDLLSQPDPLDSMGPSLSDYGYGW